MSAKQASVARSAAPPTARASAAHTVLAIALAAALLGGCGGGGDPGPSTVFDINAVVGGQPLAMPPILPGQPVNLSILAGQSIELDATEPVEWAFSTGNSPLFLSGITVVTGGISITQTALSPSRVVIDTAVVAPAITPVLITLTATSTIDAAQVATVNLLID
jgi:hypothetical protein